MTIKELWSNWSKSETKSIILNFKSSNIRHICSHQLGFLMFIRCAQSYNEKWREKKSHHSLSKRATKFYHTTLSLLMRLNKASMMD